MRQVPPCYLILGSGRMARHMAHYFDLLDLPYHRFARKTHDFSELPQLLQKTTHVLILLRDDAIEAFITAHLTECSHTLVHFSGSLATPFAYGAHFLVSFSQTLQPLETYQQAWFVLDAEDKSLNELLPGLPNQSITIPREAKALYHSLCVLSGNFTCMLWQKFYDSLQQNWQIPKPAADMYLKLIMTNILADPKQALTGPLVRNDQKTIAANLQALTDDPFQQVYHAFVSAYQQQESK